MSSIESAKQIAQNSNNDLMPLLESFQKVLSTMEELLATVDALAKDYSKESHDKLAEIAHDSIKESQDVALQQFQFIQTRITENNSILNSFAERAN